MHHLRGDRNWIIIIRNYINKYNTRQGELKRKYLTRDYSSVNTGEVEISYIWGDKDGLNGKKAGKIELK